MRSHSRYLPTVEGRHSTQLLLANNDLDEGTTVPVSGRCDNPVSKFFRPPSSSGASLAAKRQGGSRTSCQLW